MSKNMKLRTLEPAGTAEILRATQRDELMEERIHQHASDILLKAAGTTTLQQEKLYIC